MSGGSSKKEVMRKKGRDSGMQEGSTQEEAYNFGELCRGRRYKR
jgi:hypothetical protein